jgi:hypothetical protein
MALSDCCERTDQDDHDALGVGSNAAVADVRQMGEDRRRSSRTARAEPKALRNALR